MRSTSCIVFVTVLDVGLGTRYAAIDIGSNAIRMAISEYTPKGFVFLKKFRIPIRLGADVFEKGKISGKNLKESARVFRQFRQIMNKLGVQHFRAVGTSALREAKNQSSFVELIRRKSGLTIEVIDGTLEAELIHLAVKKEIHLENHRCLLIDVGGGSVELTLTEKGKILTTSSFPMGTVRTLEILKKRNLTESQLGLVMADYLPMISGFLNNRKQAIEFAVGTGGNIEAFGKLKSILLKKDSRNFVLRSELDEIIQKVAAMNIKTRIEKLKLRPDRADVILPGLYLVQTCMTLSGIEQLYIPYVGLKDGLLWSLADPSSIPMTLAASKNHAV